MQILQTIETPDIHFHIERPTDDAQWYVWAALPHETPPNHGFIIGVGNSPKAALTGAVSALCVAIQEITSLPQ